MQATYCYSCGARLPGTEASAAPLCRACQDSGPQVDPAALRWYLRPLDGRVDGPLGRDAVLERIASGKAGPDDRVQRTSGEWIALAEHPDFRAAYLPGSESASVVSTLKGREQARAADARRSRLIGVVAAGGLMVASLGLAGWSVSTRGLVFPEAWVDAADDAMEGMTEVLSSEVASAVDQGAAAEQMARGRSMPGAEVLARLTERWPVEVISEAFPLLLARGQAGILQGTRAGALLAREPLEQAVVVAPDDPEALGALAETYAALVDLEPGLTLDMGALVERAAALAPASVAAERAAAKMGLVEGGGWAALAHAEACGDPESTDPNLAASTEADFTCELLLAELRADRSALAALASRAPATAAPDLAALRVSRRLGDWPAVLHDSSVLLSRLPGEAEIYEARAEAAGVVGHWGEARAAAERAIELEPHRLPPRHLLGELLFLVADDGEAASAVLAPMPELAGWSAYPSRTEVLLLLSQAEGAQDGWEAALERADAALASDPAASGARLARARALVRLGRSDEAEATLREADHVGGPSSEQARYHLGAAMLYSEMGRTRAAAGESDAALAADPDWMDGHLFAASIRLEVDDPAGAVRHVLAAVRADPSLETERGPRVQIWYPEPDWAAFRQHLADALDGDLRLGAKAAVVDGALAWRIGRPDAESLLQRAVAADAADPEAQGALGWLLVSDGRVQEALPHIERAWVLAPEWSLMAGLRGIALARTGHLAEGRAALEEALQSKEDHVALQRWKAEILMLEGDEAGALNEADAVLARSPGDLGAWRLRLALGRADG